MKLATVLEVTASVLQINIGLIRAGADEALRAVRFA